MLKRGFGFIAFLIGVSPVGFMIYTMFTGGMHDVNVVKRLKMLILPCILIAFGVTWMRDGTFGRRM